MAAVDGVVVVEDADDERRYCHHAVDPAFPPDSSVGVLTGRDDAAVEVPLPHEDDEGQPGTDDGCDDHDILETRTELAVHLFSFPVVCSRCKIINKYL